VEIEAKAEAEAITIKRVATSKKERRFIKTLPLALNDGWHSHLA
jgi:hypothetical protein